MTKKQQLNIVTSYDRYFERTMYDCYTQPSATKIRAYSDIEHEMYRQDGCGLTVISYNTHMFTCAYLESVENEMYLVYHTATKRELIPYTGRLA